MYPAFNRIKLIMMMASTRLDSLIGRIIMIIMMTLLNHPFASETKGNLRDVSGWCVRSSHRNIGGVKSCKKKNWRKKFGKKFNNKFLKKLTKKRRKNFSIIFYGKLLKTFPSNLFLNFSIQNFLPSEFSATHHTFPIFLSMFSLLALALTCLSPIFIGSAKRIQLTTS